MKNLARSEWFMAVLYGYNFSLGELPYITRVTGLVFGPEFEDNQERCMATAFFLSEVYQERGADLAIDKVVEELKVKLKKNKFLPKEDKPWSEKYPILLSAVERHLHGLELLHYRQQIEELTRRVMRRLNNAYLDSPGVVEGNIKIIASEIAVAMKESGKDFEEAMKVVEGSRTKTV